LVWSNGNKDKKREGGEKMKKRTVILFTAFLIVLFVTGLLSLSWAKKVERVSPGSPEKVPILKLRMATIQSARIGTETDGSWYWEATVKNTGKVTFPKHSLTVQGYETMKMGSAEVAASGSSVPSDLAPGKSVTVKNYFTRCCQANRLRLELWDGGVSPHRKMDSKVLPVYWTCPPYGLCMDVTDIQWDKTKKEWTATVKNKHSNVAIKVTVQGLATHSSPIHWVGAGGWVKVIPPFGVVTLKGYYSDYHPGAGDRLKVEIRFIDNASWCGGSGSCVINSKEIVLP
jgi:hypothetical protein